ncbi:MAG: acyl-CoA dehydratase activase [Vicinamibacterales bacterium]|nr:acyl-CoA dehydratase activase [Vicinamibacterales bacterium]
MSITAGIDIGSTYTKAIVIDDELKILAKEVRATGFRLKEVGYAALQACLEEAGLESDRTDYVVATGIGRHQVEFKDIHVTDLTASARGATQLFPATLSILDVGGQTMKCSRLTDAGKVHSFRLNDKCAAGTGAFLEKTARYMGFSMEEIGSMIESSKESVPISGVCAVFAESEVINHLSEGASPADIMQGAIVSLVERSVQLMKRVQMEPQFTIIGGIVRFPSMANLIKDRLGADVNIAPEETVQYMNAVGASVLARRRLEQVAARDDAAGEARANA